VSRELKIPGNTAPNRYARSGLSVAIAALIAQGADAPTIMVQFITEREGSRQVAYLDGASTTEKRIWTVCKGLTHINGAPVTQDTRLTKEECDAHDKAELEATLRQLERLVAPEVWPTITPPARAGIASFCTYNLGAQKCKGSTFLNMLNRGPLWRVRACAQITYWIRDQGKDCRVDRSCSGQVERRMQEDELCLHGITWGVQDDHGDVPRPQVPPASPGRDPALVSWLRRASPDRHSRGESGRTHGRVGRRSSRADHRRAGAPGDHAWDLRIRLARWCSVLPAIVLAPTCRPVPPP
jgi:lysozyme